MRKYLWLVGLLSSGVVLAEESSPIEAHAFVSQGFIKTTANNFLTSSEKGSFSFTEAGINFTKKLSEELRMGAQLFVRNLGPTGNFNAKLDWFYLDYHPSDRFGLRFGRVKLPFGLYNESSDIDSSRAAILLPQAVYPPLNRDYLLAQNGFEVYGYTGHGSAGSLEYRLYGGTIFMGISNTPGSTVVVSELDVPYVVGGRLLWDTPIDGLRVGGTIQALQLDTTIVVSSTTTSASVDIPVALWVGSLEYVKDDLLVAAEYGRWYARVINSTNTALIPQSNVTNERAYVMTSYRVNPWLQPALQYSVFFPNVDRREGRESYQHDLAATFRFDLNQFWLVKAEAHWMRGTASLTTGLNGGTPLSGLTESWGAFLLKTTAYF